MSKLNQRLTPVANLSVVAGIVFLAAEMRQNTQAIQAGSILREAENSHYQYERGLFTEDVYQARRVRRERLMEWPGFRQYYWSVQREVFAPSFRAEIDHIEAEVEQAQ